MDKLDLRGSSGGGGRERLKYECLQVSPWEQLCASYQPELRLLLLLLYSH